LFVFFVYSSLLLRSDPIADRHGIPYDECSINPFVTLMTTASGGHSMDWYQGVGRVSSWAVKVIAAFASDILQVNKQQTDGGQPQLVATPPPFPAQVYPELEAEEEEEENELEMNGTFSSSPMSSRFASSFPAGMDVAAGVVADEDLESSVQAALLLQQRLEELERSMAQEEEEEEDQQEEHEQEEDRQEEQEEEEQQEETKAED
jgi:hypothetical protein